MKNGRDDRGRFTLGNSGGPGRRPRVIEGEYLRVLYDTASLDKWRQAVEKRVEKAIAGDDAAFAWLAGYVIGHERLTLAELRMREELGIGVDDEFDYKLQKATEVIHHKGESNEMSELIEKMNKSWDEKPYLLQLQEFSAARNEQGGNYVGEEK